MSSFKQPVALVFLLALALGLVACNAPESMEPTATTPAVAQETETVEYYSLRPETEKAYGYTHAVKIGNDIMVSGAVSMDDAGNPTAKGDLLQQMKNCYADLDKIL